MSDPKTLLHVALPVFCGQCANELLASCTAHPEQDLISIFCTHGPETGGTLLTARIGDHKGARCVHAWSVTGPISVEQAREGAEHLARTGLATGVIGPLCKTLN